MFSEKTGFLGIRNKSLSMETVLVKTEQDALRNLGSAKDSRDAEENLSIEEEQQAGRAGCALPAFLAE